MRILVLANIDVGLYKFRIELIQFLVKEHEVFFCVPDGEFVKKIEAEGCTFIPCNVMDRRSTNPLKDLKLMRFYRKTMEEIRPNVVLTYTIKPNVYGGIVCRQKNVPYIANITGLGTSIENGGWLSKIATTLYKAGLKNAGCVFFQNVENLRLFEDRKLVKGKRRLIPGSGVNLMMHSLQPYPSDEEGIRFLFVGRIMKDKGIEELLQAMLIIHPDQKKRIRLDIVGSSDEDYSEPLRLAEQTGKIVVHGSQSDVRPFYKRCHCVVLPSYHEGTANVMLEASATGRPVITTRVSGCRETFDENITGFGCEAKSVQSLVDAMHKFLSISQEQREAMGKAARAKMEREYDRNLVIQAYQQEIEVVKNKKQS